MSSELRRLRSFALRAGVFVAAAAGESVHFGLIWRVLILHWTFKLLPPLLDTRWSHTAYRKERPRVFVSELPQCTTYVPTVWTREWPCTR